MGIIRVKKRGMKTTVQHTYSILSNMRRVSPDRRHVSKDICPVNIIALALVENAVAHARARPTLALRE